MRPNKLWNTIKYMKLEKSLIAVPREQRRALRAYIGGRRTR